MLKTASVWPLSVVCAPLFFVVMGFNLGCGDVWGFSLLGRHLIRSAEKDGLDELRIRLPTPLQLEGYDLLTLSTSVSQLWNEHAQFKHLSTIKEGVVAVDEKSESGHDESCRKTNIWQRTARLD